MTATQWDSTKVTAIRNTEPRRDRDEYIEWISDGSRCGILHLRLSISILTPVGPNADKRLSNRGYLPLFIH